MRIRRGRSAIACHPEHGLRVVDALLCVQRYDAVVRAAVAVSDVTGEVLTSTSQQLGLSYEVLRFEYDDVMGFSSTDDDALALISPAVDRALWAEEVRRMED